MAITYVTRNRNNTTATITMTLNGTNNVTQTIDIAHPFKGGTVLYRAASAENAAQHRIQLYASGFSFALADDDLFNFQFAAVSGGTANGIKPLLEQIQVADQIMLFPAGTYTFNLVSSSATDNSGTVTLTVVFSGRG